MRPFVPVHRATLARDMTVRRQQAVRPIGIRPVQFPLRQATVRPVKGGLAAVANLKTHPAAAIVFQRYCRPNPHLLRLSAVPRPLISQHPVKGNRRRYAPPLALHSNLNPNAQRPPGFLPHSYAVPGLTAKTRLMATTVMPWPYIAMAGSLTCSG